MALHNGRRQCIHCASTKTNKTGHRWSKQCYICRECGRQFLEIYDSIGYHDSIKEHSLTLYVNGMGFRAIERATGENHNTVINWVKQTASNLPDAPLASPIPEVDQLDELETFVGRKNTKFGSGRLYIKQPPEF
jgi:transposase-like protein